MTAGFLRICWSQAFELFHLLGTSTLQGEENKVCNQHKILAQYHDSQYHVGFPFCAHHLCLLLNALCALLSSCDPHLIQQPYTC